MSISDIIGVLFAGVLRGGPDDPDRDRFILSKGHAALALYAALAETGTIDDATLNDFSTDGTPLGAHPEHLVRGIDFSTGSLGQGPTIAAGAALAARMQGSPRRVYALISDAELNEGSVWEAVMFAAHHRLGRLTIVVDLNGQQAFGYTKDVLEVSGVAARFSVFGWDVDEVDGHDHTRLREVLDAERSADQPPHVVIARTTFGKGVSFMEKPDRMALHALVRGTVRRSDGRTRPRAGGELMRNEFIDELRQLAHRDPSVVLLTGGPWVRRARTVCRGSPRPLLQRRGR